MMADTEGGLLPAEKGQAECHTHTQFTRYCSNINGVATDFNNCEWSAATGAGKRQPLTCIFY